MAKSYIYLMQQGQTLAWARIYKYSEAANLDLWGELYLFILILKSRAHRFK